MRREGKKAEKVALLEASEYRRNKLVAMIRERLRLKALEAKTLHELLQLDNLTINGIMLWKEKQQSNRIYVKNGKKKVIHAFG